MTDESPRRHIPAERAAWEGMHYDLGGGLGKTRISFIIYIYFFKSTFLNYWTYNRRKRRIWKVFFSKKFRSSTIYHFTRLSRIRSIFKFKEHRGKVNFEEWMEREIVVCPSLSSWTRIIKFEKGRVSFTSFRKIKISS